MIPAQSLPLHPSWTSTEEYVQSLLSFATTSTLFRNLCGGVHVLDFLTREPDLYTWVLPEEWRTWFDIVGIDDLLELLMREDLQSLVADPESNHSSTWRGYPLPPQSLVSYIHTIRIHSLNRSFEPVSKSITDLPRHIAVGMKPKKSHEVMNFAAFVDRLSSDLSAKNLEPMSIIDFGSGQNYLGRTLACPPYNKHVVAIEKRHHNVEGARGMDVLAKLTEKEKIMRNKKEYKRQLAAQHSLPTPPSEVVNPNGLAASSPVTENKPESISDEKHLPSHTTNGLMTYIEHDLVDGNLEDVLHPYLSNTDSTALAKSQDPTPTNKTKTLQPSKSIVVSIHSCGNLTHHGLRSLTLNPSVQAVAMIACCYNLLTERLGPPTFKHPSLRSNHPRLEATSTTYDPHGFPMSKTFEQYGYEVPHHLTSTETSNPIRTLREHGVRLNITARMMAVQAPYNWGSEDSRAFFKRHFYRALLQRILLDRGVVIQRNQNKQGTNPSDSPPSDSDPSTSDDGNSLTALDEKGTPLIIGTLRKSAFVSFPAYVDAALRKLWSSPDPNIDGARIKSLTEDLLSPSPSPSVPVPSPSSHYPTTISDYEHLYAPALKHLSVIWSLMAFSASVVESLIVVDRWLWLTEQESVVEKAWVTTAFEYRLSPRNLVVVGIKKRDLGEQLHGKERVEDEKTGERL